MVPTVLLGHHDTAEEHDFVVDADAAGAGLAVDHLVALGHRRIALTSTEGYRGSGWLDTGPTPG